MILPSSLCLEIGWSDWVLKVTQAKVDVLLFPMHKDVTLKK